jgi:hypothetical protein
MFTVVNFVQFKLIFIFVNVLWIWQITQFLSPNPLSTGEGAILEHSSPSSLGGRGWGMEEHIKSRLSLREGQAARAPCSKSYGFL